MPWTSLDALLTLLQAAAAPHLPVRAEAAVQRCAAEARLPTPDDRTGRLFGEIDAAKAVVICNDALQQFPDSTETAANLGRALAAAKRFGEAAPVLRRVAEAGSLQAQNSLAALHETGDGVEKDLQAALVWRGKAAEAGYVPAMESLGDYYFDQVDPLFDLEKAMFWHRRAANAGHGPSLNWLGNLYSAGDFVERDVPRSLLLFEEAARRGHWGAMYNLGMYYSRWESEALVRDCERARYWLVRASQEPSVDALQMLADLPCVSAEQLGGALRAPMEALQRRTDAGNVDASVQLAKLYRSTNLPTYDAARATLAFRRAAELGDGEAAYLYALRLLNGWGSDEDATSALNWFHAAAARGQIGAYVQLSRMYDAGTGVATDHRRAKDLFRKALRLAAASDEGWIFEDEDQDRHLDLFIEAKGLDVQRRAMEKEINYGGSLVEYAELLNRAGRFQEAELTLTKALGGLQEQLPRALIALGSALAGLGRLEDAATTYQRYVRTVGRLPGRPIDELDQLFSGYLTIAATLIKQGSAGKASPFISMALALPREIQTGNQLRGVARANLLRAEIAWASRRRGYEMNQAGRVAFTWLQQATPSLVAAAQAEGGNGGEGRRQLLKGRRKLSARSESLLRASRLAQAGARSGWEQDGRRWIRTLKEKGVMDREMEAISRALGNMPDSSARLLTAPSIAELQRVMRSDEAVLLLVPGEFGTHSLVVSQSNYGWTKAEVTERNVRAEVAKLLRDLGGERSPIALADAKGAVSFDRSAARRLHQLLVAPHELLLRNKSHVYVVAGGPLARLPLGVLVTANPTGADDNPQDLRATRWLADEHALVHLPSVWTLLEARSRREARALSAKVIAFGDPVLSGAARSRSAAGRQRLPFGVAGTVSTAGGMPLARPDMVRSLSRLPGTRVEVEAVERQIGPGARAYLAAAATETAVKMASARGDLAQASVLLFATHGLTAADAAELAEPGLVLTPPDEPTEEDDGYLTSSEVEQLDIDADWVILSACNTAADDFDAIAEAYEGLPRAFLAAGARDVMVTHWPVFDDVAADLTSTAIGLKLTRPDLSTAQALQLAMRQLRDSPTDPSRAHPRKWAPFVLVGDGR